MWDKANIKGCYGSSPNEDHSHIENSLSTEDDESISPFLRVQKQLNKWSARESWHHRIMGSLHSHNFPFPVRKSIRESTTIIILCPLSLLTPWKHCCRECGREGELGRRTIIWGPAPSCQCPDLEGYTMCAHQFMKSQLILMAELGKSMVQTLHAARA